MTFAPRWPAALCLLFLLACLLPSPGRAQQPPASTQAASAQPAQAYTLPPAKLAQAIALNRIRNILDIVYGLWGVLFLWLALATRAAAALDAWTQRLFARRWAQGLLFFAVGICIATLATLPLDLYAHHVSRAYGISIQAWSGWLGDQGKSLGLTLLIGAPLLVRRLAGHAAAHGAVVLRRAAHRAPLRPLRAVIAEPRRARRQA